MTLRDITASLTGERSLAKYTGGFAHEVVLKEARTMARLAAQDGDDGTNDLLVSGVIRTNELQLWFVAEHVVDTPAVRVDD